MHFNRKTGTRLAALAGVLAIIFLASCTSTSTVPRGWAGPMVSGNTLYVPTMQGKLVGLDLSNRNRLWADLTFEPKPSSGGFGCSSGSASVAIYGTPALSGGLLYVAGYDGKLYAINSSSGAMRWVYPRQDYLQPIVGSPVTGSGMLFFSSSDGKVYALDAETGDLKWSFSTGGKVWSTPALSGDSLYIGSFDKNLYALRIADGSKKWEFPVGGAITSTPVVQDNVVFFGSFDRYFYALNAADGRLIWRSPQAGNWFWTTAITAGGTVYAGNLDGKVYAFRATSGEKLAEIDLGSAISSDPVKVGDVLVFASSAGKVFSINPADNTKTQLIDLKQTVNAPLTAGNSIVYLHGGQDTLFAIEIPSGVMLWSVPFKS